MTFCFKIREFVEELAHIWLHALQEHKSTEGYLVYAPQPATSG